MAIRSIPEMKQAIEAVSDSFDELTTPVEKVLDTSDPMNTVDQLLDVMLYATNCAAFICDEFGVSMQSKLSARELEWRRKGIVGD